MLNVCKRREFSEVPKVSTAATEITMYVVKTEQNEENVNIIIRTHWWVQE